LKRLKVDKKSIGKIILNYSPEDIEEKLDLLEIKRNVINPAGWLVSALQANYPNPKSYKKEDNYEETIKTEEIEPEKILPPKKGKEKVKRLSREEELEWIRKIRNTVLKACQIPKV
jgi:hypothetical protein